MRLRLEGPIPPAVAAVAESDLRTAFGRRRAELSRREGARAPDLVLTVVAASERLDQIVLTLEGADVSTLTRRLNLMRVPADGRILALVVAADEMLAASADEHLARKRTAAADAEEDAASAPPSGESSSAPEAPPAASEPAPVDAARPDAPAPAKPKPEPPAAAPLLAIASTAGAPASPAHPGESTAAATFAFDHFAGAGGLTQLGFDLTGSWRVRSRFYGLIAAQARQGLTVSSPGAGTVGSRLLSARAAAGITLIADGGPLRLGFDLGVRAGRLWFDVGAETGSGYRPHDDGGVLVYADAMLTLDIKVGRSPFSVRLAAGAGLPLLAQVAAKDSANKRDITGASGVAFESEGGIVLNF